MEDGIFDGPECTLCDTSWETEQHLRDYLETKWRSLIATESG